MRISLLSSDDVLRAWDVVATLYPDVPPLAAWRAWEYAAYRRYHLPGPVLDIGCGDGRFFRLCWPGVDDVIGVDADANVAASAERSGVYREVRVAPADDLPFDRGRFASAFANCSLEHMDRLDAVLAGTARCLRPGAPFMLSVVTDKLRVWAALSHLVALAGAPERARELQGEFEGYHHLVNALPPDGWRRALERAGFAVEEHVPLLGPVAARAFLLFHHLWHVRDGADEVGALLQAFFAGTPGTVRGVRSILEGLLAIEPDRTTAAGAVFAARRRP